MSSRSRSVAAPFAGQRLSPDPPTGTGGGRPLPAKAETSASGADATASGMSRRREPETSGTAGGGFAVAVSRALGVVVVTVHGTLHASASGQLERVLEDLIDNQGNLAVVVNLRDLAGVDPDGLAVLTAAAASASGRGGKLILADPNRGVHRALQATSLANAVIVTRRSTPFPGRCAPGTEARPVQSGGYGESSGQGRP